MVRWGLGSWWMALMLAACLPVPHSGAPLRDDCPATRPEPDLPCRGANDRYCVFPGERGAEEVCYCEPGGWQCFAKPPAGTPIERPPPAPTVAPSAPPPVVPAPPPVDSEPEPEAKVCPDEMELVDTVHCTKVKRSCKRSSRSAANNSTICHEFAEGTECVGEKRRQRFCIDRYEYPSEAGGHPPVMVSAYDAAGLCAEQGKRMCFESEWTAACEGPKELPFPHGYSRDDKKCNIDNRYVHPNLEKVGHPDDAVRGPELSRLDQSVASGSMETCKSGFGVYDLTGNFDEWVRTERIRGNSKWAGLKGGAWGIVRNACRPITTSHAAHWSYYFISFRCCKEPNAMVLGPPPVDGVPLWKPPKDPAPAHPAGKPLDRGWAPKK